MPYVQRKMMQKHNMVSTSVGVQLRGHRRLANTCSSRSPSFDTLVPFRFLALLASPVVEGVVSMPFANSSRSPSFDTLLTFRFLALLATPVVEGVVSVPSADSSRSPSFGKLAFRFLALPATPVVEDVLLDT